MITETTSGNRGLLQAEPLIFETGHATGTGVDLPAAKGGADKLGGLGRKAALDLPGLSEPETMRPRKSFRRGVRIYLAGKTQVNKAAPPPPTA